LEAEEAYRILGVEPGCAPGEARASYLRLARRAHPDQPGGDNDAFARLHAAWQVVRSGRGPERRKLFSPAAGGAPAAAVGAARPFDTEVAVSVDDLLGASAVRVPALSPCLRCRGSGDEPGDPPACLGCAGTRRTVRWFGHVSTSGPCETCGGSGFGPRPRCASCGGKGTGPEREVAFRVPRGARDGDSVDVSVPASPDGGAAAAMSVRLRLRPHARWRVRGDDVAGPQLLDFADLVLGGETWVDGPGGERHRARVDPGTRAGASLTVPGGGLPRADGTRGRLVLRLHAAVPDRPSPRQKELARLWREARPGADP